MGHGSHGFQMLGVGIVAWAMAAGMSLTQAAAAGAHHEAQSLRTEAYTVCITFQGKKSCDEGPSADYFGQQLWICVDKPGSVTYDKRINGGAWERMFPTAQKLGAVPSGQSVSCYPGTSGRYQANITYGYDGPIAGTQTQQLRVNFTGPAKRKPMMWKFVYTPR